MVQPGPESTPVQFSLVLYGLKPRFSGAIGLLEEVGFQATLELSFGDGG